MNRAGIWDSLAEFRDANPANPEPESRRSVNAFGQFLELDDPLIVLDSLRAPDLYVDFFHGSEIK